jgi:RIO kinase 1
MEFIGTNRQPAPLLKDVKLDQPKIVFDQIITYMKKMFESSDLIHGDLSPFNILYHKDNPIVIDVGQAVLKHHPRAREFLHRDVHTIVKYFKRYKIKIPSEEKVFEMITGINEEDSS